MKTDPAAQVSMSVVEHRATGTLDGTRPTTDFTDPQNTSSSVYIDTKGGLFSWSNAEATLLQQLLMSFPLAANVAVNLVNLDPETGAIVGTPFILRTFTGVTFVALLETEFKLSVQQNQGLQVVANQAGSCAVWAKIERGTVR